MMEPPASPETLESVPSGDSAHGESSRLSRSERSQSSRRTRLLERVRSSQHTRSSQSGQSATSAHSGIDSSSEGRDGSLSQSKTGSHSRSRSYDDEEEDSQGRTFSDEETEETDSQAYSSFETDPDQSFETNGSSTFASATDPEQSFEAASSSLRSATDVEHSLEAATSSFISGTDGSTSKDSSMISPNYSSRDYTLASGSTGTTEVTSPGRKYGQFSPHTPTTPASAMSSDQNYTTTFTDDASGSEDESSGSETEGDIKDSLVPPDLSSPSRSSMAPSESSPKSKMRQRTPGGAAAKLMLLGPQGSKKSEEDEPEVQPKPSHESTDSELTNSKLRDIEETMQKVKSEFETGGGVNRRYQPESIETIDEHKEVSVVSDSAPSFLNKSEIFHKTAAAAINALLTPRERGADSVSVQSGAELQSVMSSGQMSAFSRPTESFSAFSPDNPKPEPLAKGEVSQTLISPATEKKLEQIKDNMLDPTKTLEDLLTAIASPDDPSEMDLGFTVRRKNACGALQVLTANAKNRAKICWTVGVLPALTSVLVDMGEDGLEAAFPDKRHRREYIAARERAIACLMNLSMPRDNRIPIFHTPDLVQSLVHVISEDTGSARRGCCAVLAYLAKSVENRLLMVQIPGLADALTKVLKPQPPRIEPSASASKKIYPWSSNEDSDSSDSEDDADVDKSPSHLSSGYTHSFSGSSPERSPLPSKSNEAAMDDDSDKTPKVQAAATPVELTGYDETADEYLQGARQNVFATLCHLVKEKDNAYHFARDNALMDNLVTVSGYHESPSHTLAAKILANLTRHRLNTKLLVFKQRNVVPAFVEATESKSEEARQYACFAIQNLAQDKSCRQELAITNKLIANLCERARNAKLEPERLAAVSALKNLCDEPANLIPMTNTPDCVATLMHLAHGKEEGVTELMQYRACDALATLSHWLRKIATSGKSLESGKTGQRSKSLFVPSLRVVTWNQWH